MAIMPAAARKLEQYHGSRALRRKVPGESPEEPQPPLPPNAGEVKEEDVKPPEMKRVSVSTAEQLRKRWIRLWLVR